MRTSSSKHSAAARMRAIDWLWFLSSLALTIQWIVVRFSGQHLSQPWETILPGLGIFGAAFLLSWAAELAQLEISQALALAFLALMAVLPEYAVDLYLAWTAAKDPAYAAYATANMTGANRILIGFGWPVILLCYWMSTRKREIKLDRGQRIDLATLLVATMYAFIIPLKRSLSLIDTAVLVGLFAFYIIQSGKVKHEQPELVGPPAYLASLRRPIRLAVTIGMFLLPGLTIFLAAEPFAEGLLHGARGLGIEEFLLIQWLAPLASESPEFIIAILFALRGNARAGFGTLVSSKVNQWTLLIGMLPLAYAISAGHLGAMPLDVRQAEEVFLTAAQSLMAVMILANYSFGLGEAVLLIGLFLGQLFFPVTSIRVGFAIVYIVISIGFLCSATFRKSVGELMTKGWRVSGLN